MRRVDHRPRAELPARPRLVVLVGVAAVWAIAIPVATPAPVRTMQRDPHPGIHHEVWVDADVPARLHLVRLDLTSAELAWYATKESDRGITTSGFAARLATQVAVNGDAFSVTGYTPRGLAIGDSTVWTSTADTDQLTVMHFRRVGERTVAAIVPPEDIVTATALPAGTQGAISGRPLLVRAGTVAASFDCSDPTTLACQRAPRSAVALSADGNVMWLVTVDGWQAGSLGFTAAELAAFLQGQGAHMAMALDGGSSATLVLDAALVNAPSDGLERRIANHLGVKYGALPRGELVGLICETSVFECTRLSGARVTLDDGRVVTTGTDGFYDFQQVTPRLACVTVRKLGYLTKTQCQTVSAGIQTYNSIVLEPGTDPPGDAGPIDAPPIDPMTDGGGGGFTTDAGAELPSPPGCCDSRTGRGRGGVGTIALVALVGWRLRRRRGTNA